MRTTISAAMSLDGAIDDCSPHRLRLSTDEDWALVAAMRSRYDAILVGAGTVRTDNPSLVIKDDTLRRRRIRVGMEPDICKVTVTRSGRIPSDCSFFMQGQGRKVVFTTPAAAPAEIERLKQLAEVFVEAEVTPAVIESRLSQMGYKSLFVEGGTSVLGMYMSSGRPDHIRLAIAPFIVGDNDAPRFLPPGSYPHGKDNRLVLRSTDNAGGMTVMNMATSQTDETDRRFIEQAIEQGRLSPPTDTAYCVGAVLVTADGEVFTGYTHETDSRNHAEEEAIIKARHAGADLRGAAIYSSMEPCTHRKSKPLSCSGLIIESGICKVVYALSEPTALARCEGHDRLQEAGLEVVRLQGYDEAVRATNNHILKG